MSQAAAIVIAAVASGLLGALVGYQRELHEAHRQTLGPHVADLGEAIHEVVALSNIVFKRTQQGRDLEDWLADAEAAAKDLKKLRRKLRYPLWGIDEGLRSLSRLPDWVGHVRHDQSKSQRLLEDATNLSQALNRVIQKSYLRGRPPRFYEG